MGFTSTVTVEFPSRVFVLPRSDLISYKPSPIEEKAEEALKQVLHQEDLNTFGITEHIIQGTQRTLRLERGNTVAKVICKSCNQTIKEIHLDQ